MITREKVRKEWVVRKAIRLFAYLSLVFFVIGILAARSVYGSVKDSALEVGDELVRFGDLFAQKNKVRINGELMNVASAVTDAPLKDVLDRFETECRAHAGGLAEEFARLPEALKTKAPKELTGPEGLGVVRKEENGRGMVACLAQDGAGGSAGLLTRLSEFAKTGDLGKIGKLRYVVAKKTQAGATHVVTAWTDGPFRLGHAFPKTGDAPGSDADNAPRPGACRRLLTAGVEGTPYGVRIYDAAGTPAEVLRSYDEAMPKLGWEANAAVEHELKGEGRAYARPGVDLMIFTERDGDRTIVSVVEMQSK